MKSYWNSIERWGPCIISLISLFAVIGIGWVDSSRISRLEGALDERNGMEIALRAEIQTWQAYVVNLQTLMIKHGIQDIPNSPAPPNPVIVIDTGKRKEIINEKRRK